MYRFLKFRNRGIHLGHIEYQSTALATAVATLMLLWRMLRDIYQSVGYSDGFELRHKSHENDLSLTNTWNALTLRDKESS
jgi:hypothetical protein